MFTQSLYLLPLLKGNLYSGGRVTFSGSKPWFHLSSGDTLAIERLLTTKIVVCSQVTKETATKHKLTHLNRCPALKGIQHATSQRKIDHGFLYII